jgi:hypothetical protein
MKDNKRQSNRYDKIFKENFEILIPNLMKNLMGITALSVEEIPDDIQHTKERKPDFLKKIIDINNETFILHLEIQVADESEMVYRMAEYNIMLLRKYKLPIHQYVIFIGKVKPKMQTKLQVGKLNFSFNVLSLKDLNYRILSESTNPEEIVFAILANFGEEQPENAVEQIIQRLDETTKGNLSFQKYIRQLRILSKLRKLDLKIDEIMESIAKYIDEEDDYFVIKNKKKIVENLLTKSSHTIAEIADFTNVTVDFVIEVQQKISTKTPQ